MRVFVTGASGFVGLAVVKELLASGHKVLGLVRSDEGAKAVDKLGAGVHRGSLEDLESLKSGADTADGVIHCAFNHDFTKFAENSVLDRNAIKALGDALKGSDRHLIVTSGTGPAPQGRLRTEEDPLYPSTPRFPRASEEAAAAVAAKGVSVSVMRLPQVHDPYKQGLITLQIEIIRKLGKSFYVGDGSARWAAVHTSDAARLYRLAIEKGIANACYHCVGEEGVLSRDAAETIGKVLSLPTVSISVQDAEQFGFLGKFMGLDMSASSKLTQERLGWKPTGPGLISDLEKLVVTQTTPA